jgi:hypothetical protein
VLLYCIIVAIVLAECGPSGEPGCGKDYGVMAAILFFLLAGAYLGCMLYAMKPPEFMPEEADPLLVGRGGEVALDPPPLTGARPTPTVTVEQV